MSEPRVQQSVQFSKADFEILKRVCQDRGENIGAFIRTATLKELAALGTFDASRAKSFGTTVVDHSTGHVEANRRP